jgi:hypothetical protein
MRDEGDEGLFALARHKKSVRRQTPQNHVSGCLLQESYETCPESSLSQFRCSGKCSQTSNPQAMAGDVCALFAQQICSFLMSRMFRPPQKRKNAKEKRLSAPSLSLSAAQCHCILGTVHGAWHRRSWHSPFTVGRFPCPWSGSKTIWASCLSHQRFQDQLGTVLFPQKKSNCPVVN